MLTSRNPKGLEADQKVLGRRHSEFLNPSVCFLKGLLQVKTKHETMEVNAGQTVIVHRGEWVQYSTPYEDGAEYLAVCYPAFSPDIVHRDK